jgi:hypothetical protein
MFDSSRLKVERAKKHVLEIHRVLESFVDSNRERIFQLRRCNNALIAFDALGLSPYDAIYKTWLEKLHRFTSDLTHQISAPNV